MTRKAKPPLDRLRHHVTGAIERGEKEAIVEFPTHCPECGRNMERGELHTADCARGNEDDDGEKATPDKD